jgi:hypothetical protein
VPVPIVRKPLTLRLGPLILSFYAREMNMADQPFVGFTDMMTQSFEQTRKAMEKYADFFQKGIKASPWLDTDLNDKMKSYIERNIAAAHEFIRKLSEAKDVQSFWQIQTDFMQAQWKAFGEQTKDLGEIVSKSTSGVLKELKDLSS